MKISRKVAALAATVTMAGAGLLVAAGPASAGTNGQQIEFYDGLGKINSVYVYGQNQNGDYVGHCFNTPLTGNYLSGWWWKGQVYFYVHTASNCSNYQSAALFPTIPVSQSGDWFVIDDSNWNI